MEARLEAIEKRLALLETPLSNEKLLRCVQCGENYVESRNPEGICEFHTEPLGDSWSQTPGMYSCCKSKSKGCVRTAHCAAHHDRYPYYAYREWFRKTLNDAVEVWVDLEHPDLAGKSENDTVKAQFGLLADNSTMFARAGEKLRLFENAMFPKAPAMLCEDKCGRQGYARIMLEGQLNVTVSVKATSDDHEEVVKLTLVPEGSRLMVKSIDETGLASKQIKTAISFSDLPSATCTAPQLDLVDPPVAQTYKQEGNVSDGITLTLQGGLDVNSSFYAQDGYFSQFVSGNIVLLNPSAKPLLVSEIWSEYEQSPGEWVKSINSPDPNQVGVRVDAAQAFKGSVTCTIKVKGEPGGDNAERARIHPSLPQPLRVRFNVSFPDGSGISIMGEKVNKKPVLPTKSDVENSNSVTILHWASCDDAVSASRHYVYVYRDDSDDIVIRNSVNSSYSYSFSPLRLARLGFRAKVAEEKVRLLEDMEAASSDGATFSCSVLVRVGQVYAFQFILKTRSGQSESYFAVPQNGQPTARLDIASGAHFKPNQLLSIKWSAQKRCTSSDWIAVFKQFAPKDSNKYIGACVYLTDGSEGTTNVRLPLENGTYELRMMSKGYCLAKSPEITVG